MAQKFKVADNYFKGEFMSQYNGAIGTHKEGDGYIGKVTGALGLDMGSGGRIYVPQEHLTPV